MIKKLLLVLLLGLSFGVQCDADLLHKESVFFSMQGRVIGKYDSYLGVENFKHTNKAYQIWRTSYLVCSVLFFSKATHAFAKYLKTTRQTGRWLH